MGLLSRVREWVAGDAASTSTALTQPRADITTSKDLEAVLLAHGNQSLTGVSVTPEVAMMVSAVSATVSLIAETMAQLPFPLYTRRTDGGKERLGDHPLTLLLNARPNDWQNAFEFREMMMLHLLLWGNCYCYKNTGITGRNRGQVRELLPIHPDRVQVIQAEDYTVSYDVALASGQRVTLPPSRIFHVRDRAFCGPAGVSRLKHGRDSIGLARVAEKWGAQLFGNGARPSGILTTEQKLNEDQMKLLRDSWTSAHGGENALGTAVLDAGISWESTALNMRDAQFIELRKFQIGEVARIYRVPPHMVGDLDKATFSNIEHQSLEFVKYALMPWLKRWESAVNTQLLDAAGNVFAEFRVEGLLRGDTKSRYEAYASALQNEWMNKNEVRILENLNPVEGGDVFRNPSINPQTSGTAGNEPQKAA